MKLFNTSSWTRCPHGQEPKHHRRLGALKGRHHDVFSRRCAVWPRQAGFIDICSCRCFILPSGDPHESGPPLPASVGPYDEEELFPGLTALDFTYCSSGIMFLCLMLLIFIGFMETMSENIKLVGPAAPLVVEAGEDLVLPCSLQPNISAVDMMVEWIRPDFSGADKLVHLYKYHKDTNDKQMKSYRGRTALFKEELQKGNTSLKLSKVQPTDQGVYQCYIESESWYDDIVVHVEVKKLLKVVGPAIPLGVKVGEDLVLPCSIKPSVSAEDMTVEWIRLHLHSDTASTLVHQYKGYEDRNDKQMGTYRGRTALFKEELKKGNASLKLSSVQPSDEGVYQCYIESLEWYDDVAIIIEVTGKGFHAWQIAIICISVFAIILFVFTAYILKDKFSEKQLSPAQCSVITYMRLQSKTVRKEFDLKNYNTSEEGYRRLIPAITNYRKVQFAGCNPTAEYIKKLTEALQTENSMRELDLRKNNLNPSLVMLLSVGLKSAHCKLEILRLAICNFTEESFKSLVTALQSKTYSMKELDLCSYDLHDSGGMELLSALLKPGDCKLEILRLPLCNLGINTCEKLESVLKMENSTLKELDLSNNDLQDSGVEILSAGLKSSHCKLEILRLPLCNLGINTCEKLESVLKMENSTLKELDLSNNDLQDSGVEILSAGLKSSHCKLEILRLSGCMITEKGCSLLASALSSKPSHLKELDLTYNHPGEAGVKLLSARREDPLNTLRMEHGGENRIKPGLKKYSCEFTLDPNTKSTADSPEPSCVSLKSSNSSRLNPPNFSCGGSGTDPRHQKSRADSHEPSCVSMKSSNSMFSPPGFSIIRGTGTDPSWRRDDPAIAYMLQVSDEVLDELDPKKFNTSVEGYRRLVPAVSNCRKALLSSCSLGIKACENLKSVLLAENSSLIELDLSNNDLQDSGVDLLSAGLKSSHCKLQILRLSGYMVTETACCSLASALNSNPSHLKELDLTYNHPGEAGVKLLSARLGDPQCALSTLRVEHGGEIRIKPGLKKLAPFDQQTEAQCRFRAGAGGFACLTVGGVEERRRPGYRSGGSLGQSPVDHKGEIRIKPGIKKYSCGR
ncbi:hypothetical protein AOLI_G00243920 [Acnodon oligacanthus]